MQINTSLFREFNLICIEIFSGLNVNVHERLRTQLRMAKILTQSCHDRNFELFCDFLGIFGEELATLHSSNSVFDVDRSSSRVCEIIIFNFRPSICGKLWIFQKAALYLFVLILSPWISRTSGF